MSRSASVIKWSKRVANLVKLLAYETSDVCSRHTERHIGDNTYF